MSVTKRKSGTAVVFEAPNGGVVAVYAQGVCYVAPICTPGLKSSISELVPDDATTEELVTQAQFLELLAQKTK